MVLYNNASEIHAEEMRNYHQHYKEYSSSSKTISSSRKYINMLLCVYNNAFKSFAQQTSNKAKPLYHPTILDFSSQNNLMFGWKSFSRRTFTYVRYIKPSIIIHNTITGKFSIYYTFIKAGTLLKQLKYMNYELLQNYYYNRAAYLVLVFCVCMWVLLVLHLYKSVRMFMQKVIQWCAIAFHRRIRSESIT